MLLESVILRLLDIGAAVINYVNGYSHLPRDQTPSQYHSITDGVPGVHHIRRPQDMTKMHKNSLNARGIHENISYIEIFEDLQVEEKMTFFTQNMHKNALNAMLGFLTVK